MADAKRKRAAGVEPEKGDYVRLSPSVEDFMGGKRYCKESELTRCRLLAYERSQGRISECVQLVRVTVTTLDGKTTTHTLDSEHHEVRDLKNHVGEKHGLECDAQNLSYAPTAGGTAKVSGDYLPDDELLKDGAHFGRAVACDNSYLTFTYDGVNTQPIRHSCRLNSERFSY